MTILELFPDLGNWLVLIYFPHIFHFLTSLDFQCLLGPLLTFRVYSSKSTCFCRKTQRIVANFAFSILDANSPQIFVASTINPPIFQNSRHCVRVQFIASTSLTPWCEHWCRCPARIFVNLSTVHNLRWTSALFHLFLSKSFPIYCTISSMLKPIFKLF